MEDEDSENGLVDTWSLWEKAYKDTVIGTSLSQINNSNVCMNEIEENRENCFYSDYSFNSDENKNSEENLNNKVKRLKKKNFKQVHESQNDLFDNNISITQVAETNNTHKENKTIEVKIEKMAEYTQYLGLQPALMKSECSKCNTVENISCEPKSNSCQCECSLLVTPIQENSFESSYANHSELASTSISESSSILTCKYQSCSVDTSLYSNLELPSYNNHEQSSNNTEFRCNNSYELPCSSNSGLTGNCSVELAPICSDELSSAINSEVLPILPTPNFKITRKVYLCAACETYFENWNLFLHMRETHKRHICLFCLGMFGQAERLSRHLSKKHNIPEITFQSVEEFYKTFKGSCYVMCCSCEKIFSETENFYNHFCSLDQNQQTSELCSIPQKISSVKTCNIDSQNNYENRQLLSNSKLYNINYLTSDPNITGIRRYSKRTIKPNRSNDDVYLYTKLKNIRSKRNKFQNTSNKHEISKCINEKFKGNNFDKSSIESRKIHNLIEDTVAETIMEVSKFRENVDNNESKIYASNITSNSNKIVNEIKSLNSNSMNNIYDNVTKTIMEVSSCKHDSINISQTDKISIKDSLASNKNCSLNKGSFESSDPKNEDDVRINQTVNNLIQTKDIGAEKNFMHDALTNYNSDCGSQICNSPSSPTARSVFNPICDAQETSNKASKNLKLESKSLSSITSVTDRSLVIKICTKNNSIFSVQTPKHRKKFIENLENSKESEENNNGQISNNKISVLEKNDSIKNKFHTNEQDNDSSNNTVAVNDNYEDKNGIHNPTVILDLDKENKPNMTINHIDNKKENKLGESLNIQEKQINDTLNTNNIENTDGILLAGEEIPIIDLNVDSLLESMEIEDLLKLCIKAVCAICVYCNHARHIAVNGKQLSLHMLTEHRFQPQHPAIIIHQEQFTTKIKKCLEDLKSYYFNLDSYNSKKGTYNISTVKVYECFLCRFCSSVHKELYLHNRKMHQKPILICIMCKSTFCSYSELLCHLCPGVYAANINVQYRCCLCSLANLPSAFRLMVHLRKQHHACDVCLESTGNQQRLSNHVWKHKLHHLCYRCGIAYRNKPDITKHLFWKHGTESVLCKKCLQKKWPHIYHFCIPPTAFACEECGFSFSRAVALKVHKRIHTGDFPYSCFECSDKFISKKLLAKHEQNHKELSLANEITLSNANYRESLAKEIYITTCSTENNEENYNAAEINTEIKEPVKKVVDVYDLPPLNLSSDSDSDIEDNKIIEEISTKFEKESNQKIEVTFDTKVVIDLDTDVIVEVKRNEEDKKQEEQIMDGIWDNFKSYTASLEKQESSGILIEIDSIEKQKENGICKQENGSENSKNIVLTDHDYCIIYSEKSKESVSKPLSNIDESIKINEGSNFNIENIPSSNIVNRQNIENDSLKKKYKSKKKKQNISTSSSDSSSDSDSSSCSCGTNCSCSSSSSSSTSSSSSSSDSESSTSINLPCKIHLNREKRKKEKEVKDKIKEMQEIDEKEENKINKGESIDSIKSVQLEIMESDLDTSETETDEDFYDEQPQQLVNKILEEKRNRLVLLDDVTPTSKNSDISSVNNGIVIDTDTMHSSTPTTPVYPLTKMSLKRRIKARKRKRDVHGKVRSSAKTVESIKLNIPKLIYQKKEFISKPSSIKKYSSSSFTDSQSMLQKEMVTSKSSFINLSKIKEGSTSETDVKRSSKRKRVPKRFYGDSSDEENHKLQMLKWRRVDISPSIKYQLPSTSKNLNHKQNFKQKEKRIQYPDEDEGDEDNETENERIVIITPSGSDSNEPIESCSDSTDSNNQSDSKNKNKNVMLQAHIHYPQLYPPNLERANNLYCYCQCPYDEVSEMIACDGDDCQIEWFHFECVGIMIPPKGKWYCPDCRRRLGIPDEIDDFHNG